MLRRALLSVSDKHGIEDFARGLVELGFEIISTGGTQKALEKAKINVTPVEKATGFPECFGGRLKTLHPLIFGGILFKRNDATHVAEAKKLSIEPIDLVCVNLYPFEETAAKPGVTREEVIEQIDIGGPSLLRAAAKNAECVTVVCDPADYPRVLAGLDAKQEASAELRKELAAKVYFHTSAYDTTIASVLSNGANAGIILTNRMPLRYGENPHQWGAFYELNRNPIEWKILQQEEKQMSYLNILDADGAWNLVCEFEEPTAACIKHANPCGVASHQNIAEAFQRAYDADRLSAFGVIIALNRTCTKAVIEKVLEQKIFVEIIIAPSYEPEALALLKTKPKIRVIENHCTKPDQEIVSFRTALGGMLVQNLDTRVVTEKDLKCVTDTKPSKEQIRDLLFAWKVVKHAKSNAIVS